MQWMQYEIGPESDFALQKKKKKKVEGKSGRKKWKKNF